MITTTRPRPESETEPSIEAALRYAVAIGAVLVLLLPAARGSNAAIGWVPLWLLAMPLMAWWALHRFRLPPHERTRAYEPRRRRSRWRGQARRVIAGAVRTPAQSRAA